MVKDINYIYVPGDISLPPILLLHGTGGDEMDLLAVADQLAPKHPKLAIRGRINEGGKWRYFERVDVNTFNLASLEHETDWLIQVVQQLVRKHGLLEQGMLLLGYSNGANIGAYAILTRSETPWQVAMLYHARLITPVVGQHNRTNQKIFATYGEVDPLVTYSKFSQLMQAFQNQSAQVSTFVSRNSHAVSPLEITATQLWLQANQLVIKSTLRN